MRRPRISIARLMGAILVAGIGLAALREGTEELTFLVLLLGLILFIDATFQATLVPPRGRAWWVGFSTFGWSHLFLSATKMAEFLPTYFLVPERVWGLIPRTGFAVYQNRSAVLNVLLSVVVAWIGGGVAVLYVRVRRNRISPSRRLGPLMPADASRIEQA